MLAVFILISQALHMTNGTVTCPRALCGELDRIPWSAVPPDWLVAGAGMRAFVAATATQHAYNESFPVPALGDLHRVFADLPSPCEVILPQLSPW